MSEDEINLILSDLPEADDTPIPQAPNPENLTSALIVLSLLDGVVTMALGAKCAMTKDERKMMADPLNRMMDRLPVAQIEQYGKYVDPVLFIMGLIAWGNRINRIRRDDENGPGKPETPRAPKPPKQSTPKQESVNIPDNQMAVPPELRVIIGETLGSISNP